MVLMLFNVVCKTDQLCTIKRNLGTGRIT